MRHPTAAVYLRVLAAHQLANNVAAGGDSDAVIHLYRVQGASSCPQSDEKDLRLRAGVSNEVVPLHVQCLNSISLGT
jgi:hypothetical protein